LRAGLLAYRQLAASTQRSTILAELVCTYAESIGCHGVKASFGRPPPLHANPVYSLGWARTTHTWFTMPGKKGCYWGCDTNHNKAAWVALLGLVVSGAALLAIGIKTVNGCHEQYQTCRALNGPLSDLETDKCVPVLSACAKPGIAQYTIGAILLAGLVLPAFYFCCCAIKPDEIERRNPAAVVPEMDGVGKKTQSLDYEKQASQQVRASHLIMHPMVCAAHINLCLLLVPNLSSAMIVVGLTGITRGVLHAHAGRACCRKL
jgi:hypothetical protein